MERVIRKRDNDFCGGVGISYSYLNIFVSFRSVPTTKWKEKEARKMKRVWFLSFFSSFSWLFLSISRESISLFY